MRRAKRNSAREIIDDLGHHPAPIDRIDARERKLLTEAFVAKSAFTMFWASSNVPSRAIVWTLSSSNRRHLPALHIGDAAIRVKDKNIDLGQALKGGDGGGARVARRRADDSRALASRRQHILHQPAKELHREILERQGRPAKQFEQKEIVAKLRERRDRDMIEPGIS